MKQKRKKKAGFPLLYFQTEPSQACDIQPATVVSSVVDTIVLLMKMLGKGEKQGEKPDPKLLPHSDTCRCHLSP